MVERRDLIELGHVCGRTHMGATAMGSKYVALEEKTSAFIQEIVVDLKELLGSILGVIDSIGVSFVVKLRLVVDYIKDH